MRIVYVNTSPFVETSSLMGGQPGRTSVELEATLRFQPETPEEADFLMTPLGDVSPLMWVAALMSKTMGSPGMDEPTPSSLPSIVVSIRPAIDGAPSMAQVVRPGVMEELPMRLVAIAPDGGLMTLHVPLEVRVNLT